MTASRQVRRVLADRERGAAASFVVIFLAAGVVFAASAISIDVGQLLWERREVQNGADAAAFAAAQDCAKSLTCAPSSAAGSSLVSLAGANAVDGRTAISSICRSAAAATTAPTLPECPAPSTPTVLVECPAAPAGLASGSYLEVRTQTENPDGSGSVTSQLASAFAGATQQTTVKACARAAWGPADPGSMIVLPMAISYCDWDRLTTDGAGGRAYANQPVGAWPGYDGTPARPWPDEKVVWTKANPYPSCPSWQGSGSTAPGGFASLNDPDNDCKITLLKGDWLQGQTGAAAPCPTNLLSAYHGREVFIPIFDCVAATPLAAITPSTDCTSAASGNNTYYHFAGFASFYLSGWYVSAEQKASVKPPNAVPCSGDQRCVSGWFLRDLVPAATIKNPPPGSAPNFGLNAVQAGG